MHATQYVEHEHRVREVGEFAEHDECEIAHMRGAADVTDRLIRRELLEELGWDLGTVRIPTRVIRAPSGAAVP